MSDSQTNHCFELVLFGEPVDPVHRIRLSCLKQFKSWRQHSSASWPDSHSASNQNTAVSDTMMINSALQLLQQSLNWGNSSDSVRRPMSRWYAYVWKWKEIWYSFCDPWYAFLALKVLVAADLHFMYHQRPQFQLKIFFTFYWRKKSPTSWMALQQIFILGWTTPWNNWTKLNDELSGARERL